ncbi:hypothetical protein Leryth_000779 [Lithospermum erythrorhizon]|nr:hypothetical protein Leryth_000779 [Lithospermum erythrorhizon]
MEVQKNSSRSNGNYSCQVDREQGKGLQIDVLRKFGSSQVSVTYLTPSSTMVENPSAQPIDEEPNSLVNDDPEVPKGSDPPVPVKCSEKLREEQNVSETEDQDDHDGNAACKINPANYLSVPNE